MAKLIVKKLAIENPNANVAEAAALLEAKTEKVKIETVNWKDYPYQPEISFKIGHNNDSILLKFYVTEKNPKAVETKVNGDVYKDSCVEFFLSPKADGSYYNFEFNCIGTPHVGYGPGRHDRQPVPEELLAGVTAISTLGSSPIDLNEGDKTWEMLLIIPKDTMLHDEVATLSGLEAKGNFYKCGDETAEMHFVTWNAVGTENPDYHQYPFFGDIVFE
ncbi:hypothetical protein EMN47_15220 [Prolixibacteraceae bacterium JC049]|nr:hypothetical protein [Prolixibacteraceae bacterium JC049]